LKWIVCENGVIQNNLLIGRTANSVTEGLSLDIHRSVTWYHLIYIGFIRFRKLGMKMES
jgi:hypothetical protein